jgi:hypothetical protein
LSIAFPGRIDEPQRPEKDQQNNGNAEQRVNRHRDVRAHELLPVSLQRTPVTPYRELVTRDGHVEQLDELSPALDLRVTDAQLMR